MHTSADQDDDVHENWSIAGIAARLHDGHPEDLAVALRPIAARLAEATSRIGDPSTILLDLGRVADSLLATVDAVIEGDQLDQHDDDEVRGAAQDARDALSLAASTLDQLSQTY